MAVNRITVLRPECSYGFYDSIVDAQGKIARIFGLPGGSFDCIHEER